MAATLYFRLDPADPANVTAVAEDDASSVEVVLDRVSLMRSYELLLGVNHRRRMEPDELKKVAKRVVTEFFMDVTNAAMAGRNMTDAVSTNTPAAVQMNGEWMVEHILEMMEYKLWPTQNPPVFTSS